MKIYIYVTTVFSFLVFVESAFSNHIDILSQSLVSNLSREYTSMHPSIAGERYIAILPFTSSGSSDEIKICKLLNKKLSESFNNSQLFKTVNAECGCGHDRAKQYTHTHDQGAFHNPLHSQRHLYVTGFVERSDDSFLAHVSLVDPASGENFESYVNADPESQERRDGTGLCFKYMDAYMENPININAWLNDIYISFLWSYSFRLNLGITNLYLNQNYDIGLLDEGVYPHLLTSPGDGYNNFDPVFFSQFNQLATNKCMPSIGFNYQFRVHDVVSMAFDVKTTLFFLSIPVDQKVHVNPYADLFYSNEDAARVLTGKMPRDVMNNKYPAVMFRVSINPQVHVSERTTLGAFFSFFYSFSRGYPDQYEEFRKILGLDDDTLLKGYDISLMGLSFRLSISRIF